MPDIANFNPEEMSMFLGNFSTVANANLTALGYTAPDITAINALKSDIDAKLTAQAAAQEAARAATQALRTSLKAAKTNMSVRNKVLSANINLSNALRAQLGLNVPDGKPTDNTPQKPDTLFVTGSASGINFLKWGKGLNKPGVQYVIEAKIGASSTWTLVDAVTATKYDHVGQTPGVRATYRVRARRKSMLSPPSVEGVIYG